MATYPNTASQPAEQTNTGITPEQTAQSSSERMMRLDALAATLSNQAIRTWGLRQTIENRWFEDLKQYNGEYDEATLKRIQSYRGSEVFINITRPKTKTAEARLGDMLFPTDDRNWELKPTPVPELTLKLTSEKPAVDERGRVMASPPNAEGETRPVTEADQAMQVMTKAKKKAEAMGLEIEDQLTEAKYPLKARMCIHDACTLGTGVLKGPIVVGRTRRKWVQKVIPQTQTFSQRVGSLFGGGSQPSKTISMLEISTDPRPSAEHVDIWNFFPDMGAAHMGECRFVYERRYLTHRQLAELARDPYYLKDNIIRALTLGAKQSQLTRSPTAVKRDAVGSEPNSAPQTENELFEAWEFHGPLDIQDLQAAGVADLPPEAEGLVPGCVVFVGNVVIKAYLNPMETGELPYQVFNYEKDEASIFGFGVPYRMRNSQKVLNAAWRALMDNAGLSVGPQIIINKRTVQPADGDYRLSPRKVWEMTDINKSVRDVMASFDIESHQAELTEIINMAMRFADEETGLPLIAQGEQGPHITKTAQGMGILMNSANVVTRATVKNFDDGITSPMIRKFYDWNMQNSDKDEIKGDFEVDARGSSVLLSKELQAQNLMTLASNFAGNPIFGSMLKPLELFRKVVQAMHVSADDVVVSDEEYQNAQENNPPPEDPQVTVEKSRQEFEVQQFEAKKVASQELERIKHANRMQEFEADRELELLRMANERGMKVDELKTQLAREKVKGSEKRMQIADESAIKSKFGEGI